MKKIIRTVLALTCAVALTTSLVACNNTVKQEDTTALTTENPAALTTENPSALTTFVIYADFSNGSADAEENGLIEEDVFETQTPQTVEDLAAALTRWSGLDFTLESVRIDGKSAYVDWAANSTLVAGLDERELKEGFRFYDADSLNWFMMDSLARTIKGNLAIDTVYYSQGGNPLTFPDGQGIGFEKLPVDQPYEGSAFFFTHSE